MIFDGTVAGSVCLRKRGDSNGEWRQWQLRVSVDRLTNWVIFYLFLLLFEVLGSFHVCADGVRIRCVDVSRSCVFVGG